MFCKYNEKSAQFNIVSDGNNGTKCMIKLLHQKDPSLFSFYVLSLQGTLLKQNANLNVNVLNFMLSMTT